MTTDEKTVTTGEEKKVTSARKTTESAKKVRPFMRRLNRAAIEAKDRGQKVAYSMSSFGHDEILVTMDIVPVWTENYAGLCATKRDAERFLVKAEGEGFSNVICGYARAGLGFDILRKELGEMPPNAPDGGMAKPDLLIGGSSICDTGFKWYQSLARYLDVPIFCFDVPAPHADANLREVRPYYIKYQTEQYRELIEFLEKNTGKKLDYDRLSETVDTAIESFQWWYRADQLRKAIPSPMPTEDALNVMVPGWFNMGTKETLVFYRELYDEIKRNVDNKVGVIPEEKYRLLWGWGIPPWHNMWIFNYFEDKHKAVIAIERLYRYWNPPEIPDSVKDPVERLAWKSFGRWTDRYEQAQKGCGDPAVENLLELIRNYQVDGLIMHATSSCRACTVGQIHMRNMVKKYIDIPSVFLESDLIDVRVFNEAEWLAKIDAFMDIVSSHKKSGG